MELRCGVPKERVLVPKERTFNYQKTDWICFSVDQRLLEILFNM